MQSHSFVFLGCIQFVNPSCRRPTHKKRKGEKEKRTARYDMGPASIQGRLWLTSRLSNCLS